MQWVTNIILYNYNHNNGNNSDKILQVVEEEENKSNACNNEEDNLNTDGTKDNNVPIAKKDTTSWSEHLCKKRNHQYSSNADKIHWIAYIKDDQYVLMHKFNDMYFLVQRREVEGQFSFLATKYMQD